MILLIINDLIKSIIYKIIILSKKITKYNNIIKKDKHQPIIKKINK